MKAIRFIPLLLAANLLAQTNDAPVITAIDGYAARVNSTVITYGEVRESLAPVMPQFFQRFKGDELARQLQQALLQARETLIEESLMQEEAEALELVLPPQVIDDEIDRLIQARFNNDRNELNKALIARRMPFEEWREEISNQMTLRAYYSREVLRRVQVGGDDLQTAYEERKNDYFIPFKVKFSAILINKGTTEEDRAVKRQQAGDILKKLQGGADFSEMAKNVSEGIRGDKGGAFPWSDPKDIRAELRPALYSTAAGQISDLIETDEEFYIVKIEERREEGYTPLEDVSDSLKEELMGKERENLHKALIERLSTQHYIERY